MMTFFFRCMGMSAVFSALCLSAQEIHESKDDFLVQSTNSTVSLLGDVNLDGIVNILDVVILINIVVGIDQSSNYPTSDINSDGIIDVLDIVLAVNIIVGAG